MALLVLKKSKNPFEKKSLSRNHDLATQYDPQKLIFIRYVFHSMETHWIMMLVSLSYSHESMDAFLCSTIQSENRSFQSFCVV